jgi:integrase
VYDSEEFWFAFYLKKQHGDKKVNRPIYLRITVDGVLKEMSIKRSWDLGRWNSKIGRATVSKLTAGRRSASKQTQPPTPDDEAQSLNAYLDTLQAKVHEVRHQLLMGGRPVTAEAIGNLVQGKESSGERPHLLLEIFQYHNDQVKTLIGKEYSKGTLTKFNTVLKHTRSFLQWKYKLDDIDIRKLDYEFRWLQRDPFIGFNLALREVEREALTAEELEIMAGKNFGTDRLAQVRDIFLFSCFTGLAYADLQKLRRSEISTGIDGGKWIFTRRQKTDTASRIPILPMAQDILDRYADHPQCKEKDKVLPILSNQKMNAYLKEIADCCGITKRLTFHIARHTFATTITLSNGVPIETVSKMLGHRNLKTTQHYAKILDRKVSQDMQALKEKLLSKSIGPRKEGRRQPG